MDPHQTPHNTTAPAPRSMLDYALAYAALGFCVIPTQGKLPLTPHGSHDGTREEAQIRAWWSLWPNANVAIVCGPKSGVWVLDVDPRNGGEATFDALVAAHGALPDTVMALTGNLGRHYVFRWPQDGRRLMPRPGDGVDVLGENKYFLVEPSVHPVTGRQYAWEGSSDPLEGVQPVDAPAWMFEQPVARAVTPATSGFLSPERILELRAALAYVNADDRDTWVQVGMALHSTEAPAAYGLWTEWSQQSEKFNAADQQRVWRSFSAKRDRAVHVESIFAIAARAGWVNPTSGKARRFDEDVERAIAVANGEIRYELAAERTTPVEPIPVQILEDAARWIDTQFHTTHPAITRHAVLSLASFAASRVYVSDYGDPAHLYLALVADTVEYGRYVREILHRILAESGVRRMISGTRLNTPTQLYRALTRSPANLHVSDEFGQMLMFARRQPSGVLDQTLNLLSSLHSSAVHYLDSAADAGMKANTSDDQLIIHHPAISLFAMISTDQLVGVMRRGELGRGALGQMMAVFVDEQQLVDRKPVTGPVPDWLRAAVRTMRRLPARAGDLSIQDIFGQIGTLVPTLTPVRFEISPDEHLAAIEATTGDRRMRPLVLGAKQNMRRLATTLGAWSDPAAPRITRELLDWSTSYVIANLRTWLDRYDTLSSDDGRVDVRQRVLEIIVEAKTKGVSLRQVTRHCRPFAALERTRRQELIDSLIADEAIVQMQTDGGRSSVLVAERFVVKKGAA